ncbi:MAG: nitroreductase family protein [Bdellovibrionota bacterium]|nr:nitroreductase family protein [Bdellovibrionota bacterium]
MHNQDSFYDLVKSRRSIRLYEQKPIDSESLDRVIEAGLYAPSGKNEQNWRFIVLSGEKKEEYLEFCQKAWLKQKDVLKDKLKPSLYEFTERFFYTLGGAPVVVLCYSASNSNFVEFTNVGSVFMAMQNIMLAATIEGLGSCSMGAPLTFKKEIDEFIGKKYFEEEEKKTLDLVGTIVLGWPAHEPPKAERKRDFRVRKLNS